MQVHVSEDWTNYSTLWRATVGFVKVPIFQVSCFEHPSDQRREAFIVDFLLQQLHQYLVVDVVEVTLDVKLNEPLGSVEAI